MAVEAAASGLRDKSKPSGGVHVIDWQAIIAEHGPHVWRTVSRLVSHREDALDCYQETFLAAAQYSSAHAVSNWRGLLKQIATGRAIDCLRRRYRTEKNTAPLEAAAGVADAGAEADSEVRFRDSLDRLRRALVELPTRQSKAFCLRELELMSAAEVAAELNATPDEVAVWLHRAKIALRQVFAGENRPTRVRR